jgi:hypothetical protein
VFTNAKARKLLADFSIIGRDILARGALHAAEKIRPDQEQLQNVNQSAPADTFITEGGRRAKPGETPVLQARIPGTDARVTQHPHDDLGYGMKVKTSECEYTGEEARQRAVNRAAGAARQGVDKAKPHGEDVRCDVDSVPTDEEKSERAKVGLMDKIKGARVRFVCIPFLLRV